MMNYAIFGNPIKHSQSPQIHYYFSKMMNIKHHTYGSICSSPDNFRDELQKFFLNGGLGANITVPYKQIAYTLVNRLTDRALLSGSVNTIKKLENNQLLGDNTDGIGILNDLTRLQFLHKKDRILILGAGGAAHGIIYPLLHYYSCSIIVTNRTWYKAEELINKFKPYGIISAKPLNQLEKTQFNLIINATSCGIQGIAPNLPNKLINSYTRCYDMFYHQSKLTPFLQWCQKQGSTKYVDGIGMLVSQAAYSFLLWHGVLPSIISIIKKIRYDVINYNV
ncbi:MAG: shikimate dehydrogenase [Candidatus Dasytiphilus stammeri]